MAPRDSCLVIFTRFPSGYVERSSLVKKLGEKRVVLLMQALLTDMVNKHRHQAYDIVIAFSPKEQQPLFEQLFPTVKNYAMKGKSMGKDICATFNTFLKEYNRVAIVASDVPDVSTEQMRSAFHVLEDHDAVLGPSADGGHYLIGARRGALNCEDKECILRDIPWHSDECYTATIASLEQRGLSFATLGQRTDVDTFDDLLTVAEHINPDNSPMTAQVIKDWSMRLPRMRG